MTPKVPAVLVLLSLAVAGNAAARVRAVAHPAPQCAFSLSPAFAIPVASAGVSRGALSVAGNPSTCTSWNAYSLTSWVTVVREGNVAYLDVAPNPTNTARTAEVLVAGVRYTFSQEGSVVVSPPIAGNVLQNGQFNTDLSFWGWQDRFPNGLGDASWSSIDAAGNANSGSIRLRNTPLPDRRVSFQQLQCVAVEPGQVYEYGGKFLTRSRDGEAIFALAFYADATCDAAHLANEDQTEESSTPGTWQSETYTTRMGPETRSVLFVIGNVADVKPGSPTFELFIDDVFLKKR